MARGYEPLSRSPSDLDPTAGRPRMCRTPRSSTSPTDPGCGSFLWKRQREMESALCRVGSSQQQLVKIPTSSKWVFEENFGLETIIVYYADRISGTKYYIMVALTKAFTKRVLWVQNIDDCVDNERTRGPQCPHIFWL